MADTLRTDSVQQHAVPNAFSRLMESPCGGHALLNPRKTSSGGGQLGDGGYLSRGKFIQEFNLYEISASVSAPFTPERRARIENERYPYSMPLVSSTQTEINVELGISGGALPLLPPVQVNPRIALKDAEFASLLAYEPTLQDYMKREEIEAVRDWLIDNRHRLRTGTIVLTGVVRASGWVALYSSVHQQAVSLAVSLTTKVVGAFAKGSYTFADAKKVLSRGPDDWQPETRAAEYTVIVNYTRVLNRLGRLLLKAKLAVPSADNTSIPDSSYRTDPPSSHTSPSEVGEGTSETPGSTRSQPDTTDPPSSSIDSDGYDHDLLTRFLEAVLDKRQDLETVVADTSIIFDFIQRYRKVPELSDVSIIVDVRECDTVEWAAGNSGHGGVERVGNIRRLEVLDGDGPVVIQSPADASQQSSTPSHAPTPTPIPPHGDFVMKLNNLYKASGRSLDSLQWSERLAADVWHSEVIVANVGSFRGTGRSRKAAREVAAHAAYTHLGGR
ncbi:hypothetical protein EXIGLDRAFT_839070 [Exidia glandulosa HHB12029]|uniref:DRBM domain-containing protein n=1 Tax=Exidia glandulosa HHB12029 TaxID=1314781 RepID=A0A165FA69_EXIGL|nr:hypothetical protein EXIGLDRAFT_839070 [Exidia glandulosa HHB12029]